MAETTLTEATVTEATRSEATRSEATLSEATLTDRQRAAAAEQADYMDATQLQFFAARLRQERSEAQAAIDAARAELAAGNRETEEVDRAQREEEMRLQLRIVDRKRRLLGKIDAALGRIERGEYGWCEVTGEPIGFARLTLRPTATLCTEEKQRQERIERCYRDD